MAIINNVIDGHYKAMLSATYNFVKLLTLLNLY